MILTAQEYRDNAKRFREWALTEPDEETKDSLLRAAGQFEVMPAMPARIGFDVDDDFGEPMGACGHEFEASARRS